MPAIQTSIIQTHQSTEHKKCNSSMCCADTKYWLTHNTFSIVFQLYKHFSYLNISQSQPSPITNI